MTRRNVFIDDSIWTRLSKFASARGMKISEVIRRALFEFLEREDG